MLEVIFFKTQISSQKIPSCRKRLSRLFCVCQLTDWRSWEQFLPTLRRLGLLLPQKKTNFICAYFLSVQKWFSCEQKNDSATSCFHISTQIVQNEIDRRSSSLSSCLSPASAAVAESLMNVDEESDMEIGLNSDSQYLTHFGPVNSAKAANGRRQRNRKKEGRGGASISRIFEDECTMQCVFRHCH